MKKHLRSQVLPHLSLCGLFGIMYDEMPANSQPEGSRRKLSTCCVKLDCLAHSSALLAGLSWAEPEIMNSDLDKLYSNEHC